jgi:hypothetical protein
MTRSKDQEIAAKPEDKPKQDQSQQITFFGDFAVLIEDHPC